MGVRGLNALLSLGLVVALVVTHPYLRTFHESHAKARKENRILDRTRELALCAGSELESVNCGIREQHFALRVLRGFA